MNRLFTKLSSFFSLTFHSPKGGAGGGFAHAFALIRADKLFSTIYIAGTAVAIASAMVVVIVLNIKLTDIKPEVNRSRTLYLNMRFKSENVRSIYTEFSTLALDSCFRKMRSVELATGFYNTSQSIYPKGEDPCYVAVKWCDHEFFRLYDFTFVDGRPFSEKEFRNGERVCVVTENVAKKLQIKENGGTLNLYHVVGIIKPVCTLSENAVADIFYPYTSEPSRKEYIEHNSMLPMVTYAGSLTTRILLREGYTRQDFLNEAEPLFKFYCNQINIQTGENIECELSARSNFFQQFRLGEGGSDAVVKTIFYIPITLLILIFLLLPAINLSGLVSNRMESRLPEMGIRKAFGAKRSTLLREVINENLVLTLCGGAVGWVISWFFVNILRNSKVFMTVLFQNQTERQANAITDAGMEFAMFFTPKLFLICFLCCVVLNLMAALIPAWRTLNNPIVESLNQKR